MGVGQSYRPFLTHDAKAEWVWILDDDDALLYGSLLQDIKRIVRDVPGVQVIMVRMDHGPELGVLPDESVWRKQPRHGHLGISSYIVRRDIWQAHRHAFGTLCYESDFHFIRDVFEASPVVHWHDVIVSRTQQGRMIGAREC